MREFEIDRTTMLRVYRISYRQAAAVQLPTPTISPWTGFAPRASPASNHSHKGRRCLSAIKIYANFTIPRANDALHVCLATTESRDHDGGTWQFGWSHVLPRRSLSFRTGVQI